MEFEALFGSIFGGTMLIICASFAFTGGIIALVYYAVYRNAKKKRKVWDTGIPAQAKVLRIWDTGMLVNNQPRVGMALEVHPNGRTPYQVEIKKVIPMIYMAQIQPGAVLQAKVDADNPEEIVFGFG